MRIISLAITIGFLIANLSLTGAFANTPDQARRHITTGDYVQAETTAQALGTAEGFALAAEALSARILLGEIGKLNKNSKIARRYAEQALKLSPDLQNAHLQYALADGFVTRTSGVVTAWRKKLPQKTKAQIENYKARFPDDARGQALLGAWHLGVIRKAGIKNGEDWYGASLRAGRQYYDQALVQNPNDIMINVNYALSLYVLDTNIYAGPALTLLTTAMAQSPKDALEAGVQLRAQRILDVWDEKKQAKKRAGKFLDGEAFF